MRCPLPFLYWRVGWGGGGGEEEKTRKTEDWLRQYWHLAHGQGSPELAFCHISPTVRTSANHFSGKPYHFLYHPSGGGDMCILYVEVGWAVGPSNSVQPSPSTNTPSPCPAPLSTFTDLQGFWTGSSFPCLAECWGQTHRPADRQEPGPVAVRSVDWCPFPESGDSTSNVALPYLPRTQVAISLFRTGTPDQEASQTVCASVSPSPAVNPPHPHPFFVEVDISSQAQCEVGGGGRLFPEYAYVSLSHCGTRPLTFRARKWMEGLEVGR